MTWRTRDADPILFLMLCQRCRHTYIDPYTLAQHSFNASGAGQEINTCLLISIHWDNRLRVK